MDYKNINDNEILYLISDNNDEYKNILFEKYKPIVLSVAKTYMKVNTDTVLDYDDLVQIGFLGLNNAIRFYKEENSLFFTFVVSSFLSSESLGGLEESSGSTLKSGSN